MTALPTLYGSGFFMPGGELLLSKLMSRIPVWTLKFDNGLHKSCLALLRRLWKFITYATEPVELILSTSSWLLASTMNDLGLNEFSTPYVLLA